MNYRKIDVDTETYEYTIGSAMLKVKGFEAVAGNTVGETVWIDDVEKIMITPQHVANWIRSQKSGLIGLTTFEIEGDSYEYEQIYDGMMMSMEVPGIACEIGLRKGMGTQTMLDALVQSGSRKPVIAIDPYGDIPYETTDQVWCYYDYSNQMRNACLIGLYKFCWDHHLDFQFFNLEDSEFFCRYADGVPYYAGHKQLINQYSFVHFDGPHSAQAVMQEVEFFHPRSVSGSVWVFDDVHTYDHDRVDHNLTSLGWHAARQGANKFTYVKI